MKTTDPIAGYDIPAVEAGSARMSRRFIRRWPGRGSRAVIPI